MSKMDSWIQQFLLRINHRYFNPYYDRIISTKYFKFSLLHFPQLFSLQISCKVDSSLNISFCPEPSSSKDNFSLALYRIFIYSLYFHEES